MLKRTVFAGLSAAFLAGTMIMILPVERAAAEMAPTKEKSKKKSEDKTLADLKAGGSMDRSWVDAALKQLGCEFRE